MRALPSSEVTLLHCFPNVLGNDEEATQGRGEQRFSGAALSQHGERLTAVDEEVFAPFGNKCWAGLVLKDVAFGWHFRNRGHAAAPSGRAKTLRAQFAPKRAVEGGEI